MDNLFLESGSEVGGNSRGGRASGTSHRRNYDLLLAEGARKGTVRAHQGCNAEGLRPGAGQAEQSDGFRVYVLGSEVYAGKLLYFLCVYLPNGLGSRLRADLGLFHMLFILIGPRDAFPHCVRQLSVSIMKHPRQTAVKRNTYFGFN